MPTVVSRRRPRRTLPSRFRQHGGTRRSSRISRRWTALTPWALRDLSRSATLRDACGRAPRPGERWSRSIRSSPRYSQSRASSPHMSIGLRPFDVQLAAGVALANGRLAQLATGEGKTLAAVPARDPARRCPGQGIHIFTANDYLAQRDAAWMAPLYVRFRPCAARRSSEALDRDARRAAYARGRDLRHRAGGRLRLLARSRRARPRAPASNAVSGRRLSTKRTASWSTKRVFRWSSRERRRRLGLDPLRLASLARTLRGRRRLHRRRVCRAHHRADRPRLRPRRSACSA